MLSTEIDYIAQIVRIKNYQNSVFLIQIQVRKRDILITDNKVNDYSSLRPSTWI